MLPGIPAALFMAVTKKLLKARSSSGSPMGRMKSGPHAGLRLRPIPGWGVEKPVEKIPRGMAGDVRSFRGEREQSDDIPVMAIRWRALKESIF